ncbi:MAG: glutamate 5-kinase [Prolixibacteraceae bacterium]|nr:glutamate 5-kinase [Prolixibacteraceae bacterium]MBN2649073.1 glutamate 5-kinase [Prolixibacteraceae bacterium]
MHKKIYKRIAVKVGSNVLASTDGTLDIGRISHIVDEISNLKKQSGVEIILISSGAVAAGRSLLPSTNRMDTVSARQLWSAVGQVKLINTYSQLFAKNQLFCAQVLTTKENFSDRRHYLNMKNCISTMLDNNVVPIVNENDTISVTELMFTDNDELSGLISSMMNCQALIILSNVDGIYNGNPNDENTSVIENINASDRSYENYISMQKSGFGRGGMHTKYNVARKIALEGIDVFIANGTRNNIISGIIQNEKIPFTRFHPNGRKLKSSKKWLAHSDSFAKGIITVNQGAKEALFDMNANSLLLIGVTHIKGFFKKGDIIRIQDEEGNQLGLGKSQYNSDEANELIGKKARRPLIYYDYMFLYE